MMGRILVSRAARSMAYGALAVVLAAALAARGFSPIGIGAAMTAALLAGALTSAITGRLVRTFGSRSTYQAAGIMMIVAAALLAGAESAIVCACLLGVVSPGGQDVGPFAAIEQSALANEPGVTRRLSHYNLVSAVAIAFGALAAAVLTYQAVLVLFGAAGVVVVLTGTALRDPRRATAPPARHHPARFGIVERLAVLFAIDAFAGGFIVQAFIAYWFSLRFGVGAETIGPLLFGANLLAAASYVLAAHVAARIGLLNTMVFTHLPSNVLLCLLPFMPTFPLAASVLLLRFALSQMDVPTRQAYTLALVPPDDRARAAGVTAAVRPAAASIAPLLTGIAFQLAAAGLPFILAGGIKIAYDLSLLATFRHVALPEPAPDAPMPGSSAVK